MARVHANMFASTGETRYLGLKFVLDSRCFSFSGTRRTCKNPFFAQDNKRRVTEVSGVSKGSLRLRCRSDLSRHRPSVLRLRKKRNLRFRRTRRKILPKVRRILRCYGGPKQATDNPRQTCRRKYSHCMDQQIQSVILEGGGGRIACTPVLVTRRNNYKTRNVARKPARKQSYLPHP